MKPGRSTIALGVGVLSMAATPQITAATAAEPPRMTDVAVHCSAAHARDVGTGNFTGGARTIGAAVERDFFPHFAWGAFAEYASAKPAGDECSYNHNCLRSYLATFGLLGVRARPFDRLLTWARAGGGVTLISDGHLIPVFQGRFEAGFDLVVADSPAVGIGPSAFYQGYSARNGELFGVCLRVLFAW